MKTYTLKMFNTGQVTLPKGWRSQYATKHYVAIQTEEGLLLKPLLEEDVLDDESRKKRLSYFGAIKDKYGKPLDFQKASRSDWDDNKNA